MSLALLELVGLVALPVLVLFALLRQRATPPPGYALLVHGRRDPIVRGSTFVLPLLESRELVQLAPLPLSIARLVADRNGERVAITLLASVHLPEDPARLRQSIELLGGRSRAAVEELARDALEGTLAHAMAGLDAHEARRDPARLERALRDQARAALREIGLDLETLSLSPSSG